jgi:hypothetical protein
MKSLKGSKIMNTLIALGMMANAACGLSPLLNHDVPNRATGQEVEARTEMKCKYAFAKQGLCADVDLSKAPKTAAQQGSVKIYFWNPNRAGAMVNPSVNWKFTPWMSGMGHGTGKTDVANAKDENGKDLPGVFIVSKLEFVMGGDWDLFIVMEPTTRDPNKEPEQRNVEKISYFVNE